MATTPLAYNPSLSPIAGTTQVGSLAVGTTDQDYSINPGGVPWWMGPEESDGYVIAVPVSGNTQPTPVFSGAPSGKLTLSPTYIGNSMNLSNGNQTVHQFFGYVQSVLGQTLINGNDKVMFSVFCSLDVPATFPNSHYVGIGTTSMNYNGVTPDPYNSYPGNDNQSIGLNSGGEYWYNGSIQASGLPTWTSGDTIDVAVSLINNKIWIRVNGGNWNNSPTDNPATGTGGQGILGGLTSFYPVLCPSYEGTMTIQNSATYGVPSGYTLLGSNVTASVGFFKSTNLTDSSFLELTNSQFNQNFASATEASTWLTNNGYWNSYGGPVLYLDANNLSSYPGTGTTWYDISGNGNDVTMVNSSSIAWSNSAPVYFSTGANGWFNNPSGSNLPTGNANYTFIIWIQLGSTWNGNGFMSIGSFGATNQSNAFRTASTQQLLNYWWANDLVVQDNSVSPTNWFNAVATYDGTTRSIWVNGSIIGSDSPVGHNVITSALQIAKTGGNEFLNGNVGEVLIYDRGLTSGEILGIYNATKSRYGY
jgi:hypothetical protein